METSQGAQWNTSMFSPGHRQILRLWIIARPQEGHDGLCSLSADDMETMYPNSRVILLMEIKPLTEP